MSIIGTFTKQATGYTGSIDTLTLKAKVTIAQIDKTAEKAPDFRVFAGKAEIGAAWSASRKDGRPYLTVKLDDPSFPAPIACRLVEMDGSHALVWTR
jgi:uncharacterized protein (DUF736 family)